MKTFHEWKEEQKWLNPVPDDLSITDLNAVWKAAERESREELKKLIKDWQSIKDEYSRWSEEQAIVLKACIDMLIQRFDIKEQELLNIE